MNIKRNITNIFRKQIERKATVPFPMLMNNLITSHAALSGGRLKIGKI